VRLGVAATAPFGADVLERLADRFDVAFLLTRADRPKGRGRRVSAGPAKAVAERLGIPVLQPERLDESVELPPADAIVVAAYGLLIPEPLLARGLGLNVHPSLLPRWRGAAPVERAILAGDEQTGVTIHETVAELDAGPVAAQEAWAIGDADAGETFARAGEAAARLLEAVLPEPRFEPQRGEATYAEKIAPADRELDLDEPVDAWRRVRALSPHIGARGELHGRRVTVWRAHLEDGRFVPEVVQPEGRRRMGYDEFLRGAR
jgi:methionyl-tRNA formyltransferase